MPDARSAKDAVILELELPAWTVDPVVLDTSATNPVLINRVPEPGEVQVAAGTEIALEITDVLGGTVLLADTRVYVEGALAFDAGVFQPGFQGPGSASSNPFPHTLRVVVDPEVPFVSLQDVQVRVVSLTSGADAIDETYSFVVEDLTAPRVTGAISREPRVVRVGFDETVNLDASPAASSALNPANWSIERIGIPSVAVVATSAERVVLANGSLSTTAVDLVLDVPITPRAQYRVVASNVVDAFGNAVDPDFDSATFLGFAPAKHPRRRLSFWRLMPGFYREEDADGTGDLRKLTGCWDEVLDLVLYEIDRFFLTLDPETAPEQYVDLMLRDLGDPFGPLSADLTPVQKRKLVEVLVLIYQKKGTPSGLIDVVRFFLGVEIDVLRFAGGTGMRLGASRLGSRDPPPAAAGSWRLNMGSRAARYSFDVVSESALTADQREQIRTLAEYMKPGWTHLVRIVEPAIAAQIDHVRLGRSRLGVNFTLH